MVVHGVINAEHVINEQYQEINKTCWLLFYIKDPCIPAWDKS